jgi:hypothetical protein
MQIVSSADKLKLFMEPWLRRHGCSLRDAAKAIAGLLSHNTVASAQGFEAIADAGNLRSVTLHARLGSRLENSSLGRHGASMVSQYQSPPRRNADRRKPRGGHRVPPGPGVAIRRPFTTRALDAERQDAQVYQESAQIHNPTTSAVLYCAPAL